MPTFADTDVPIPNLDPSRISVAANGRGARWACRGCGWSTTSSAGAILAADHVAACELVAGA